MDILILSANNYFDESEYSKVFPNSHFEVVKTNKSGKAIEKKLIKYTEKEEKPDYVVLPCLLQGDFEKDFRKTFAKLIDNHERKIQEKPWEDLKKLKKNKKEETEETIEKNEEKNEEENEEETKEIAQEKQITEIKYIKKKTHIYKIETSGGVCYSFMYNGVKVIASPKNSRLPNLPALIEQVDKAFSEGEEKYPQGYTNIEKTYIPKTFLQKLLPQKTDPINEIIRKSVFLLAFIVLVVTIILIINEVVVKPMKNRELQSEIQSIFYQETTDPVTGEVVLKTKNWDKLKKINKEIVGWVKVNNTHIDYPILYCKNDHPKSQFYLYKDYKKEYSDFGSLYVDHRSTKGMKSKNVIVHGHNIGDGSMFSDIDKYAPYYTGDLKFYKKSPTIEISTPEGTETYKIFSVFKTNVDHVQGEYFDFFCNDFESNSQFLNYIYNLQIRSLIQTPVKVNEKDQLLTLVTCSYTIDNFRMVVVARKCREGENKKVNVSKAYIPSTSLWPQCYYDKYGRTRPSVSTFKTEYQRGNIKWYDGKYKEDGDEQLPTSYDVEIPTTAPTTKPLHTVQVFSNGKLIYQKHVKDGYGFTLPSIDKTFEENGYKYTFERWSFRGSSSSSRITKDTVVTAIYSKEKVKNKPTEENKKPTKKPTAKPTTKPTKPTTKPTQAPTSPPEVVETTPSTEPSELSIEQEE